MTLITPCQRAGWTAAVTSIVPDAVVEFARYGAQAVLPGSALGFTMLQELEAALTECGAHAECVVALASQPGRLAVLITPTE